MKQILNFWFRWKIILIVGLLVVLAWFGLGYYLHAQAKQSRARVEQKRIEASRRQEVARRQARYQQAVEQYQKASANKSRLYGE